ncbi:hypothetical protein RRG08_016942 [Elysia crispata]|uniref:Uncharacterized protein n=1 Tax=Elysia crispata TaxID=231223 RepID=A0AAE1A5Y4_9GAST|nr:hypothetical protein RRG08_016942 [Elysia crispata]
MQAAPSTRVMVVSNLRAGLSGLTEAEVRGSGHLSDGIVKLMVVKELHSPAAVRKRVSPMTSGHVAFIKS